MFKKVTTLLLVFILLAQLISPVMNVNADEGSEDADIVIDYDTGQIEIEEISEELLEIDEIDEELSEIDVIEEELSEVEVEEEDEEETIEIDILDTEQVLEQATINTMRALIENNSAENPFIVPAGMTFNEAINALGWGEGVTVRTPGSYEGGAFWGSIILYLNLGEGGGFDDHYVFFEISLIVHYEYSDPTINGPTVWTDEELAFVRELTNRLWGLGNDAWTLVHYIDDMYHAGILSDHPNGAELYRLLHHFLESLDYYSRRLFDDTLPFAHEHNINALAELNTLIAFLESFIAQITAALDDEVENNNNNNNNQPTLPQTGTGVALNTMLAGSGLVALGGLTTYKKLKKN